ncbi:MAG: DUF262 domain-containing protein [Pyrinomonadaceae bacterium]
MSVTYKSSDQIVQWFRDEYRRDNLKIKPPFQRKPVWAAKQKCYLVESILLGVPIPEIYIQREVSATGDVQYALVDGQQRIRTVLQFIGADLDPREQDSNQFILDKLRDGSPWKNLTFAELSEDEKIRFYNYSFAVRFLTADSETEIRDVFRRLNQFQSELKPQELRNAIFGGPFMRLAQDLADDEYWAENRIVSPALIRRMNDIEFVSELLIGVMHGPQGGSAKDIDEYFERFEDYEDEFPGQREAKKLFNLAWDSARSVLPEIKSTRWSNKTDFYTLFVAFAALLRSAKLPANKVSPLRKHLIDFADRVKIRLADEKSKSSDNVVGYVRAVEKGANDKKRRGDRHLALVSEIEDFFK